MKKPQVTAVIPTYNRPGLVGDAIKSVLSQTFENFEIIVVDDGVEIRAQETVRQFSDERIRYIAHEKSKGCSAAKNTGIKEARGRYIAFLDDDDTWEQDKLEKQVAVLEKTSSDISFSFHAALEIFDEREYETSTPEGVGNYYELALRKFSAMIASSLMFKREVFDEVGVLDESFPTHTDIEFLLRVTKKFKGVGINKPLVRRAMQSSHMQMGTNLKNRIAGREMLLSKYKDAFVARPLFLAKHLTQLAKFYRDDGQFVKAAVVFWRAFRIKPTLTRLLHTVSMFFWGIPYRVLKRLS